MPTVTFPDFLAWSRVFIADHGREDWRETWRQRSSRARPGTCASSRCVEPLIFARDGRPDEDAHQGCDHCDRCQDHCECYFCSSCGNVADGSCEHCDNGECCCECLICEGCNRECSDNYCSTCSDNGSSRTCDRCCEGHPDDDDDESSDRNIELFTSPLTFHAPKLHERKVNASKRFLSVEIEVASIDAGYDTAQAVHKWRGGIVEDGSLPRSGFEINTAPAGGDKFVEQITEICAALARGNASVTAACGLHVHIDARDFDHYTIRRLVDVYALIEDALFGMASPSRRTSTYCTPCGKTYQRAMQAGAVPYKVAKANTLRAVYDFRPPSDDKAERKYQGRNLHSRKKNKYESARYHALNLHSWFYRGTVECRIFNGSTNRDKIVHWGMLWARILDYAARKSDKEIAAELADSPLNNLLHIAELPVLADFIRERTAKFAKEDT